MPPVSDAAREKRDAQRYKKLVSVCTGEGCYKILPLRELNTALAAGEAFDCPFCGRNLVRS